MRSYILLRPEGCGECVFSEKLLIYMKTPQGAFNTNPIKDTLQPRSCFCDEQQFKYKTIPPRTPGY